MKRLALTLALLAALAVPTGAQAKTIGSPSTNNEGAGQNERAWYGTHCDPTMPEWYDIGGGKWRHLFIVCKNDPYFYDACAAGYYWTSNTGRSYYIPCGREPRYQDTWCWTGTHPRGLGYGRWIRGRDLYHGWERVSNTPCERYV